MPNEQSMRYHWHRGLRVKVETKLTTVKISILMNHMIYKWSMEQPQVAGALAELLE